MTTETKTEPRTRSDVGTPVVPPRRPGTGAHGAGFGGGGRGGASRGREPKRPLGLAILVGVVAVVALVLWLRDDDDPEPDPEPALTVVKGAGGKLKESFLNNPEVKRILLEEYGLVVDLDVIGSIEMLSRACDESFVEPYDFLWAGDQSTLDIYTGSGGAVAGTDNIYNSPMVIYSWTDIVDALVAAGYAQLQPDGSYSLNLPALVDSMMQRGTWADLGLSQYHGEVLIHTSDPARSNSGYLFAGMLANMLNGQSVVSASTVGPIAPEVAGYFARLGYMEPTSGELFSQFLTTGRGAKPMIAAYESQLPEFVNANPQFRDQIQGEVRLLYPEPTVWATHPLIARNEVGERLLEALNDPEIQARTWVEQGQRPGIPSVPIDPAAGGFPGIREQITSVIDIPATAVMSQIIELPGCGSEIGEETGSLPPATALTASRTTPPLHGGRGRRAGRASRCRLGGCSRWRRPGGRR